MIEFLEGYAEFEGSDTASWIFLSEAVVNEFSELVKVELSIVIVVVQLEMGISHSFEFNAWTVVHSNRLVF